MITNKNKTRAILLSFIQAIIILAIIIIVFEIEYTQNFKEIITIPFIITIIVLYPINLKSEKKRIEKEYRQIAKEELYYEKIYEEEKNKQENNK